MNANTTKRIAKRLLRERRAIIRNAGKFLAEDPTLVPNELPDVIDQACSGYAQSMVCRLRDRESRYLDKIAVALGKTEAGSFGICEACGQPDQAGAPAT